MEIRQFFTTRNWWGKCIGAFFGFLMAGPFGAIFGLFVGNFFDRGLSEHFAKPFWPYLTEKNSTIRQIFFESTFLLLGYLSKLDGRVSEEEIDAAKQIMQQMQLNSRQNQEAKHYFTQGKQKHFDLNKTLKKLSETIGHQPTLIRLFIETQYQFIRKTGLSQKKLQTINQLLATFHLSPLFEQPHVQSEYRWSGSSQQRQTPTFEQSLFLSYQTLGLKPSASEAEVKRAYRRLISAHHPDKMIAKGASTQAIKAANEKTQHIRQAYEHIMKTKGYRF